MTFKDLGLNEAIIKSIEEEGYEVPSPIQEQVIPYILQNKDVLGCAHTGTGKTAAFALPLIHNLILNNDGNKNIKVLVLTPTRELAIQVRDNFRKYSKYTNLKCSVILGGVNQRSQIHVLKTGVDILVATPGRLLDLIKQGHAKLNNVRTLVLDEADTMLDMGFIHDVKKIMSYIPSNRQNLLFSATMPESVKRLATEILKDYITVNVNKNKKTVDKINQSVYLVDKVNKPELLLDLLNYDDIKSVLIFVRTKRGADKLHDILKKRGVKSGVIHGDKSQSARITALNNLKNGENKVLVATDIAARGIDITELSHVINYEMPEQPETYIHRVGRTGRAGFSGIAISLCNIEEKKYLKNIERTIKLTINVVEHNYPIVEKIKQPDVTIVNEKRKNNSSKSSRFHNNNDFKKNKKHNSSYKRSK